MTAAATLPAHTLDNVFAAAPGVIDGLRAIRSAIHGSGIDQALLELAFVRTSQINGCAFCIGHHMTGARKAGVAERKLLLLAAWRDVNDFSVTEKAVLAYAEAITRIEGHEAGVNAPLGRAVADAIGEDGLRQLALGLAYINAWNRIGAVFGFQSPDIT